MTATKTVSFPMHHQIALVDVEITITVEIVEVALIVDVQEIVIITSSKNITVSKVTTVSQEEDVAVAPKVLAVEDMIKVLNAGDIANKVKVNQHNFTIECKNLT